MFTHRNGWDNDVTMNYSSFSNYATNLLSAICVLPSVI